MEQGGADSIEINLIDRWAKVGGLSVLKTTNSKVKKKYRGKCRRPKFNCDLLKILAP